MLRPFKNLLSYIQKTTNGFSTSITAQSNEMNENNLNNSNSEISLGNKNNENSDLFNNTEEIEVYSVAEPIINPLANNFEKCHVVSIDLDDSFEVQSQSEEPEFEASDLILNNEDLNNAFQSGVDVDPLADPLDLLDTSNNVNIIEESSLKIDLTGPDENILCIIDVEQIKEKSIFLDEPDASNNSIVEADKDLQIIGEEHEIRSDGSDSGLGSETSANLQSSTSASANVSINKTPISNLKRRSNVIAENSTVGPEKRKKKSLHFNIVNVYYFPRIQGFGCVPSQGGCTLGMSAKHINSKTFTLAEHAAEQRRAHKQQLQEINPKGSSSEESDSDDEISEGSSSDLDADTNGFLQPVTAKQRRTLLKAAGVRKIDPIEKEECRTIRSSREFCGCNCRGFCDPDTCACSQAGIKCQVDRQNFPCGCSRDGCANIYGRIEFNPDRVRRHYIHTITRLNLENKEQKSFDSTDGSGLQTSHLLLGYNYNLLDDNGPSTSSKYYNAQSSQNYSNGAYDNLHHNLANPTTITNSFGGYSDSIHLYSSYGEYTDVNYNPTFHTNYQNYDNSNYFPSTYSSTGLNGNSTSAPTCSQIETYDLTSTDNTSNYINLHTPLINSMDEINDLLHNNRNTPPTAQTSSPSTNYQMNFIDEPTPLHPTTIAQTATTCSLASSGQTSTTIIEGTSISISESICSNSELEISFPNSHVENSEAIIKDKTPISIAMPQPIRNNFSDIMNMGEKSESFLVLRPEIKLNMKNDTPIENKTVTTSLLIHEDETYEPTKKEFLKNEINYNFKNKVNEQENKSDSKSTECSHSEITECSVSKITEFSNSKNSVCSDSEIMDYSDSKISEYSGSKNTECLDSKHTECTDSKSTECIEIEKNVLESVIV